MALTTYRPRTAQDETPLRRRATGLALALAVNLLLLLALLTLGVFRPEPDVPSPGLTVNFLPDSTIAAARPKTADVVKPAAPVLPALPVRPPPAVSLPARPVIESAIEPERPLAMIELSKHDYAAADIGKLPRASAGSGASANSEEVGRGPNGETLYAAEWARKPTAAELGGYLPKNAPDGWGLIACKTIPQNRVDDCIELGSHPRGSQLSRAVRQAAWQFRVRPPRRNGRSMVGEWVSIRIEYYRRE
ncbi:MAG: hypothetical protein ACR2JJ_07670 [Sphingomicrobium sp.]